MSEIVKVQRPIFSSDPNAPWLIYAEGARLLRQVPDKDIPEDIKRQMGDSYKGFFKADWTSLPHGSAWVIHNRVPDKDGF